MHAFYSAWTASSTYDWVVSSEIFFCLAPFGFDAGRKSKRSLFVFYMPNLPTPLKGF